tara:strand:- start:36 stop:218 length:183 start_codon:yes stop_codon:yes gene_type:complete
MTNFFEIDEIKKSVKVLNLDDFSIEDLEDYISQLDTEILRVREEIKKKNKLKKKAEDFFK